MSEREHAWATDTASLSIFYTKDMLDDPLFDKQNVAPAGVVVAGNPARIIRRLPDAELGPFGGA